IAESWCAPNYYWIEQLPGVQALDRIFHDASTTKTNGDCYFNVTIGSALRQPIQAPIPPLPPPTQGYPLPSSNTPFSFDVGAFVNDVISTLMNGNPSPVGFELAVRDPDGKLVQGLLVRYPNGELVLGQSSIAWGSATGSSSLPATPINRPAVRHRQH